MMVKCLKCVAQKTKTAHHNNLVNINGHCYMSVYVCVCFFTEGGSTQQSSGCFQVCAQGVNPYILLLLLFSFVHMKKAVSYKPLPLLMLTSSCCYIIIYSFLSNYGGTFCMIYSCSRDKTVTKPLQPHYFLSPLFPPKNCYLYSLSNLEKSG